MSAVPTQFLARPHTQPTIEVPSLADLIRLVRATAADTHRWQSVLRLPDGKDRWWTLLSTSHDVDVWLLSWRPGQATDLHDLRDRDRRRYPRSTVLRARAGPAPP